MTTPQHEHDCDGCVFLGRVGTTDVWQCDGIDLILRHGSGPEENKSLPISIVRTCRTHDQLWQQALSMYDNYRLVPSHRR
jgi:hypothetical protein